MSAGMGRYHSLVPPLVVSDVNAVVWDESADMVIVGFGGAGAVAAIQAREGGASVFALDRFAGGGATQFSGGVIYAGNTKHQRASGISDTAEEMFKYLDAEGSALSGEALKRFCNGSANDVDWLDGMNIPRGGNPYPGKSSFPPDGYWLYYSGNEKTLAHAAKPAARGHRVVTPGMGGHVHYARLREAAFRLGVKLVPHAPVIRLVLNERSEVIGVEANALPATEWKKHQSLFSVIKPLIPFNQNRYEAAITKARELEIRTGKPKMIRANHGVVLSAGGFIYNLEMLNQYRPELGANYKSLLRFGSMGDDGSGIGLGESVGGKSAYMNNTVVGRVTFPENLYCGIIVNSEGDRFVNEAAYICDLGEAISKQPRDGSAWLILPANQFWNAVKKSFFTGKLSFLMWGIPALMNIVLGGTRKGPTLRKLAAKIGVDPERLEQSVATHNKTVKAAAPDPLGKLAELMQPIDCGPYYALNFSLNNPFSLIQTFTLGGLIVDEKTGAVLRTDGTAIKGLYAAGRTAVGLCSNGYVASGLSIADTVFSGRRVGREISRIKGAK